jgi:UDP-glucose 4,6-dehydratase
MDCDTGIYNVVNTGSVTTAWVTQQMAKYNIKNDFSFFQSEEEFYKFGAKAPRSNCLLDNSKLLSSGVKIRNTEEAIEESLKNWKKI